MTTNPKPCVNESQSFKYERRIGIKHVEDRQTGAWTSLNAVGANVPTADPETKAGSLFLHRKQSRWIAAKIMKKGHP
jgi:hypothetical protein